MAKVYMFIYTMIIFYSMFISTTISTPCHNNEECSDHICIHPEAVPECLFDSLSRQFFDLSGDLVGICTCILI
ncbi:unnamed protein product [Trifolium pratense]|uniref:Uncharacterized protein n=1 Tax=Trifolium pratense TaxID=57577 RepID=A0ACB0L9I3_TRIPR|nr:unnamed protein product [Trifolium pratense]